MGVDFTMDPVRGVPRVPAKFNQVHEKFSVVIHFKNSLQAVERLGKFPALFAEVLSLRGKLNVICPDIFQVICTAVEMPASRVPPYIIIKSRHPLSLYLRASNRISDL